MAKPSDKRTLKRDSVRRIAAMLYLQKDDREGFIQRLSGSVFKSARGAANFWDANAEDDRSLTSLKLQGLWNELEQTEVAFWSNLRMEVAEFERKFDDERVHVQALSPALYDDKLTFYVTTSQDSHPLYVSVGHAGWCYGWLERLYQKYSKVKISQLLLFRMYSTVIKQCETQAGYLGDRLDEGYLDSLDQNIRNIQNNKFLRDAGVAVEVHCWPAFSPFHGYLFGDRILIAEWGIDKYGCRHVNNDLLLSVSSKTPKRYLGYKLLFDQACQATRADDRLRP